VGLLEGWRQTLADGGVLYVSFKDARLYDKTPYQWHLDWHFLQRTEEGCLRLFDRAGFKTGSLETMRDETGIIMSFVYRRLSSTTVRIDAPTRLAHPVSTRTAAATVEEASSDTHRLAESKAPFWATTVGPTEAALPHYPQTISPVAVEQDTEMAVH
jgi:hypothetical protein